jgi:hypothetical protein
MGDSVTEEEFSVKNQADRALKVRAMTGRAPSWPGKGRDSERNKVKRQFVQLQFAISSVCSGRGREGLADVSEE